jgi:hypothetical protein
LKGNPQLSELPEKFWCVLEVKADGKLAIPRAIVDSKDLAEIREANRGFVSPAAVDIVGVAVEKL